MEKVNSYSKHLLFSLTLSSALFPAAPAMGQAYSSTYPAPSPDKTEIYDITRNGTRLIHTGVVVGDGPEINSSFPDYKNWRVLVTGQDGIVNSQRIFSTDRDDRAFEAVRTPLGELMIIGHVGQGFTQSDRDLHLMPPTLDNAIPLLVKMNAQGMAVFQSTYEMGGLDDHAYSIVRENNNSFMILGRSYQDIQDRYVITLMNVDLNGNVLDAQMIHDGFRSHFFPRKLIRTIDGGFLIAAVRDNENTSLMHAPDPVDATITGKQVAMIKLDVNRNLVFTTLVTTPDLPFIGVKDMVEDNLGNVTFVGISAFGSYVMTMDINGNIFQEKLLSSNPADMQWEPKSIAPIAGGMAVSGTVDVGQGVPRIELNPLLNVTEAKRHFFGRHINSIEGVAGGLQFLGGATTDDALVLRWMLNEPIPICDVQDEQVNATDFRFEKAKLDMFLVPLTVTKTPVNLVSAPPATRLNNCLLPAPKTSAAEAAAPAAEAAVSVSPNPAHDQLQLFVPGEEDAAYTLHDLQGRLLASGTLRPGSQALPVADLARGVYVLRVHNTQLNSTHRISLQH